MFSVNRACNDNFSHLSFHLLISKSCIWFGHSNFQSNDYLFNILRSLKNTITEQFFLGFLQDTRVVFHAYIYLFKQFVKHCGCTADWLLCSLFVFSFREISPISLPVAKIRSCHSCCPRSPQTREYCNKSYFILWTNKCWGKIFEDCCLNTCHSSATVITTMTLIYCNVL